jgi:hypothetical protein
VDTDDPTYVYNQARCYQQNDRFEQALARFREYLRKKPDLAPADRAVVDAYIAECETRSGKTASPTPAESGSPASAEGAPPPTPVVPSAENTAAVAAPSAGLDLTAPIYKTWWFWTGTGALVAAGVATAVILSRGGGQNAPICTDCNSVIGVRTR